jgi:hypothetical protein
MSSGCNSALRSASLKAQDGINVNGKTTGLAEGLSCPEKDRCNKYSLCGAFYVL